MLAPRDSRARRDLQLLASVGREEGFEVGACDDLDAPLVVAFAGPAGSPFAGARISVRVTLTARYPFEPPQVSFLTAVHHPNVDGDGRICLDLLKMPPRGAWRPTVGLVALLHAVVVLLAEPNPDDPLVPEIAREYVHDRATYDARARASCALRAGAPAEADAPPSPPSGRLALGKRRRP